MSASKIQIFHKYDSIRGNDLIAIRFQPGFNSVLKANIVYYLGHLVDSKFINNVYFSPLFMGKLVASVSADISSKDTAKKLIKVIKDKKLLTSCRNIDQIVTS